MLPKRAIAALATTAVALALLFSFKTPDLPIQAGTLDRNIAAVSRVQVTPAPTASPAPAATADGSTATPAPTVAPTLAPAPTAAPTQAPAGGGLADGTVTGSTVQTRFGPVQVQLTISGGSIVDVTALQVPSGDRRSWQISQYAEPILRSEALQAQSASIDLVSGATYTSDAYTRSLQAALDQARG